MPMVFMVLRPRPRANTFGVTDFLHNREHLLLRFLADVVIAVDNTGYGCDGYSGFLGNIINIHAPKFLSEKCKYLHTYDGIIQWQIFKNKCIMEKSNIFLKNLIDLLVISPYNQSMKALTF